MASNVCNGSELPTDETRCCNNVNVRCDNLTKHPVWVRRVGEDERFAPDAMTRTLCERQRERIIDSYTHLHANGHSRSIKLENSFVSTNDLAIIEFER